MQIYEEIVREWFHKLRPEFLRRLTLKFSSLTLEDAENLYQDAFIAVYNNLQRGAVKEDTNWHSYILTIGFNLANKIWKKAGITDSIDEGFDQDKDMDNNGTFKYDAFLSIASEPENETLYENEEVKEMLGKELSKTKDPCKKILRLYYEGDCSMEEIAEEVGFKNSATAKAKKSQCMKEFIARLNLSLQKAGYNISLKKRNPNGKH